MLARRCQSMHSLLSAVEMTHKMQINPSGSVGTIVRNYSLTCLCVVYTIAMATIRGQHLFRSELPIVWLLFEGSDYSRVASIRRNTVFTFCIVVVYKSTGAPASNPGLPF